MCKNLEDHTCRFLVIVGEGGGGSVITTLRIRLNLGSFDSTCNYERESR
jgi:hypothetical protein